MFYEGECLYQRSECLQNFNEFLCIYLGEGKGVHYAGMEHLVNLYYRTALWMFTKLGRDEVLMAPYMH